MGLATEVHVVEMEAELFVETGATVHCRRPVHRDEYPIDQPT